LARLLRELLLSLILATSLFVAIDGMASRNYVDGPSMEPLLHTNERLLISRVGLSGPFRPASASGPEVSSGPLPPRGALVTFIHPTEPGRVLVKRIVGLEGEDISIVRGRVYVDGTLLDEPYVASLDTRTLTPGRIPLDSVYVLGDNRANSLDSRYFGPVPRSNLLGVVVLRYWPLSCFSVLLPGLR
jgi:signal peptidase I